MEQFGLSQKRERFCINTARSFTCTIFTTAVRHWNDSSCPPAPVTRKMTTVPPAHQMTTRSLLALLAVLYLGCPAVGAATGTVSNLNLNLNLNCYQFLQPTLGCPPSSHSKFPPCGTHVMETRSLTKLIRQFQCVSGSTGGDHMYVVVNSHPGNALTLSQLSVIYLLSVISYQLSIGAYILHASSSQSSL
jgi:hypothetical protein